MFFRPGVLNIFCDASVVPKDDGTYFGCPGAMAINNEGMNIDTLYRLFSNSTNNHSEITAILLSFYLAHKHQNYFREINIFSDSQISVFGLRNWMYGWLQNKNNGRLLNSCGEEVANQEIFLQIIQYVLDARVRTSLYHVKGHVDPTKPVLIAKAIKTFKSSNGIDIDMTTACILADYNDKVDNFTRDTLKANLEQAIPKLKNPIFYNITRKDVYHFNQLTQPRRA